MPSNLYELNSEIDVVVDTSSTEPVVETAVTGIISEALDVPSIQQIIEATIEITEWTVVSDSILIRDVTGAAPGWFVTMVNASTDFTAVNTSIDGLNARLDTVDGQYNNMVFLTNEQAAHIELLQAQSNGFATSIYSLQVSKITEAQALTVANRALDTWMTSGGAHGWFSENIASIVTATSSNTSKIEQLGAGLDGLEVTLTATGQVVAGYFSMWDGIATPLLGQYKFIGNVQYQFLGVPHGELGDGWVRSDKSASDAVAALETSIGVSIADLQTQIDGEITSWFDNYVPTNTTEPWATWLATDTTNGNTIEQDRHTGDLFYDTDTGAAYRFIKTAGVFSWSIITDTAVTTALANAAAAQTTADGKATIYYQATAPTGLTADDTGDRWINSTTSVEKSWSGTAWIDVTNTTADQAAGWAATSSNLITDPNGIITGWAFADGSYTTSEFKIFADNFGIVNPNDTSKYMLKYDSASGKLSTEGSFTAYNANGDRSVLDEANLYFYKSGDTTPYKYLKHIQTASGIANGTTVTLYGFYDGAPSIMVSAENMPTYDPAYPDRSQTLTVRHENLAEVTPGSNNGQWKFDAVANLNLGNAGRSMTIPAQSANIAYNTTIFYSGEVATTTTTLSSTCGAVTFTAPPNSINLGGVDVYVKIQAWNGSSWVNVRSGTFTFNSSTLTYVLAGVTLNTATPQIHKWRTSIQSTSTQNGYQPITASSSNVVYETGTAQVLIEGDLNYIAIG